MYAKDEKPTFIPLKPEDQIDIESIGPDMLREEVIKAMQQLADGKSKGSDGIPAEMWKAVGSVGLDAFVELCNTIYTTVVWPHDWLE